MDRWWFVIVVFILPVILGALRYYLRMARFRRNEPAMDHGRKDGMIAGALGIQPKPQYTGARLRAYEEGLRQGRFIVSEGDDNSVRSAVQAAGSIDALKAQGMDVSSFE